MARLDALSDLLEAARSPERRDRVALVEAENPSHAITYGQLDALCGQLGAHLRGSFGLEPGDAVSIVLPRRVSLAQVVGTLGVMAVRHRCQPPPPSLRSRGENTAAVPDRSPYRRRGSCRRR
jgi:acyl-CoA synthetase (AMP-forming)/AMP-acid ligase II